LLAYDRLITGCDLDLYLTFDNVKVGELQARFLADRPRWADTAKRSWRIYGSKTDNNARLFKGGSDSVSPTVDQVGRHRGSSTRIGRRIGNPRTQKRIANARDPPKAGPQHRPRSLASNDGTAGRRNPGAHPRKAIAGKVIVTGQGRRSRRLPSASPQARKAMTIYKPLSRLAGRRRGTPQSGLAKTQTRWSRNPSWTTARCRFPSVLPRRGSP